jgi:hypothetical protein
VTGKKPHLTADTRRASAVIAHISKPGNEGISNKQAARDLGTNEAYIRRAKSVFDWGETTRLDPNVIRRDGSTQPRAVISNEVVADYSELIGGGAILPPVRVFYDGTNYWLADGFHRVLAAMHARRKSVEAVVMTGGQRDAILYSVGANNDHGLRRTNEDKRRSVTTLLMDEEWGKWSDGNIADRCKVSDRFVSGIRSELLTPNGSELDRSRTYTRNGKTQTMKVGNIGRKTEAAALGPDAPADRADPEIPTCDPFDDVPVIASGPMPEFLRNPDPPPAVEEDARREQLRRIRDRWPGLADVLGRPEGRRLSGETLHRIALDLELNPQD